MKTKTWVILGATSIIAEEFASLAAQANYSLVLVGREVERLKTIAANLQLRYGIKCDTFFCDFAADLTQLIAFLQQYPQEINLFIAYSMIIENQVLNYDKIDELLRVNSLSTAQIINAYLQKSQAKHRLVFLSSVAACRGRAKNSLYGGSKAAIETYLSGLQQTTEKNRHITIARLGFIDTKQTFGSPGIFYASPPKDCAKACWKASYAGKRLIYHPFFWRFIMMVINYLPFFIYKRMGYS